MKPLKLYLVSEEYVNCLKGYDPHIMDNKDKQRPYVGVVLSIEGYKYFVPMESPKPNHRNIKPGYHIFKIDNGNLGLLGFNNMIPIPSSEITLYDIANCSDNKYAELLRRQVTFINRKKETIFRRAEKTYFTVTTGKNNFLKRISCDFKKLEQACKDYKPK